LSKKRIAFFILPIEENNIRLVPGDELKIKCEIDGTTTWKSRGHIVKITTTEEICLELKNSKNPPTDPDKKFTIEFVWKSTSFDRMKYALKVFLKDEQSVSEYIFYKILGYKNPEQFLKSQIPKQLSVPGQPELNHFQINAVKKALVTPLCLI
jgi:regulator of nonsense transcripts 1